MKRFSRLAALGLMAGLTLSACQNTPASPVPIDISNTWTLDAENSGLTYVTVKNADLAEINTFRTMSGQVEPDGSAEIEIDLSSVDTNNEIRDPRMREVLFEVDKHPTAIATAQIDPTTYSDLMPGQSLTENLDMTITLHGYAFETSFYVLVTRLSDNQIMVQNKAPLILDAKDFGFGEGLETLRGLAGLDMISPVVPVTMTLVFESG